MPNKDNAQSFGKKSSGPRLKFVLPLAAMEFKAFLMSPSGGLAIFVFLGLSGLLFYNNIVKYASESLSFAARGLTLDATTAVFCTGLSQLGLIILLVTPLTTMKAFAPYTRGGHEDLLQSWPLKRLELVLGQYLAALLALVLMTVISLIPYTILLYMGTGSLAILFCSALGLILMCASFAAVGLAVAAKSASPMAAALATLGIFGFLWTMGWAAPYLAPQIGLLIQGLAFSPRLGHFTVGLIDTSDLIYFVTLTFISLWLCRPVDE